MGKNTLSHTTWKCQYYIVLVSIYTQIQENSLYGQVRSDLREITQLSCLGLLDQTKDLIRTFFRDEIFDV